LRFYHKHVANLFPSRVRKPYVLALSLPLRKIPL